MSQLKQNQKSHEEYEYSGPPTGKIMGRLEDRDPSGSKTVSAYSST
jgi:hypothetical protein